MEISSRALPAVAGERATMFVALELSKSPWLVALPSPVADKVSPYRFAGGDVPGLLALIVRKQAQAETRLGQEVRILCCYAAGYDGFWRHRLRCARGIDNRVRDAASILVDRRSRRAKPDRLDAAGLRRTLRALDRGESRVCRVVRVPSVAQEDARRRRRERSRLVGERGPHSSRIKGLLMTLGVRDFAPARRDWQERRAALRTPDGQGLPACLKAEITREGRRRHQVIAMIAEVEAAPKAALDAGQTTQLRRLRGIGRASATVLVDEVFFRDVRNRREVAGDLGLASPWASGRVRRDQGMTKSGNPRARRTAIKLAWLGLRHQPDSTLAQWFRERVGTSRGRMPRIMLVALARKLIIAPCSGQGQAYGAI